MLRELASKFTEIKRRIVCGQSKGGMSGFDLIQTAPWFPNTYLLGAPYMSDKPPAKKRANRLLNLFSYNRFKYIVERVEQNPALEIDLLCGEEDDYLNSVCALMFYCRGVFGDQVRCHMYQHGGHTTPVNIMFTRQTNTRGENNFSKLQIACWNNEMRLDHEIKGGLAPGLKDWVPITFLKNRTSQPTG